MTSDQARALREELYDAGFRPVAISNPDADHPAAGKAPFGRDWTNAARQDPPEALRSLRLDALNTGILCDGLRVLDIDVDDVAVAQRIRATAIIALGETVMRVRDNSPRCLLPYRAAEGEPAKRKIEGRHGKVEILGRGQQFVAYGRHPSGAELRWLPEPPHLVPREQLPAVTEEQVTQFFALVAPLLEAAAEKPAGAAVKPEDTADLRALLQELADRGAAGFTEQGQLPPDTADRLREAFGRSRRARDRWAGLCDDLFSTGKDHSRSGMDMSLAALLKGAGLAAVDVALALLVFPHGGALDRDKHPTDALRLRYAARTALRAGQTRDERPHEKAPHGSTSQPGEDATEEEDADGAGPPPRDAAGFELNEDGVALGFAAAAQGWFVFDHTSQQWFRWTGGRWALDAKAGAFHQVRLFCRKVRERQPEPPKAMAKIAFTSNVERAARTDPRLAVSHEDWDRDRWLLGVPGGVIDLRTGEHGPGDPKHFIRRQTAVAPAAPGTPAPLWSAFLKDVTRDDADLQDFLQRLAGYVLTGDVSEEVLTFLYGPGGNGKGVFLGAIVAILADYAVSVPIEVFVANSRLNLEYYRARMVGARLVTASETEAGATWSESLIKELTGNEAPLSARDPYGKPFTFLPHFKLCLVGNHAPRLKGRTPAMERRLRVVPFTHEPARPDPDLKDKLRAEYPAILRWMLDGCVQWRAKRLGTSKAIGEATSAYFQQQDGFRRWIEECCHLNPDFSARPGGLFADFTAWARDNGETPVSSGEFREMIERTKGLRYVAIKGTRYVRGIALKPQAERNPPPPNSADEDESCAA